MSVGNYPLNDFLAPMKPANPPKTLSGRKKLAQIMNSEEYIAEEKIDGCHYFSVGGRIFSPRVSVVTGSPVEKTSRVPHLSRLLASLGESLILDGEICVPGGKSPDVVSIMGSDSDVAISKQDDSSPLTYVVFDVLRTNKGQWLTDEPWWVRRQFLEMLFKEVAVVRYCPFLILSPILSGSREALLDTIWSQGKEGLVLKYTKSVYHLGKRPQWEWIKLKCEFDDDVIIMGFEAPGKAYTGSQFGIWPYWETPTGLIVGPGEAERLGNCVPVSQHYAKGLVGSIKFGKYTPTGSLIELGTCSGFDESLRAAFSASPEKYLGAVIKVKAMEKTESGAYRHTRFISLHSDKNASECRINAKGVFTQGVNSLKLS